MKPEIGVGNVLSETLALVGDASRDVGLYVLAVGGFGAVGAAFGWTRTTTRLLQAGFQVGTSTMGNSLYGLVASLVGIVAGYVLLTRYLAARGRYTEGPSRFWPYLGMAIVSAIAVVLGMLLLIVPGLILLVRWSAATGFVIGDREGVSESLAASWQATSGHGWAIFWAALILFIGVIVVSGVVGGLGVVLGGIAGRVVSAFVQAGLTAVTLAFGISVYVLVHENKRELGEVFA